MRTKIGMITLDAYLFQECPKSSSSERIRETRC